MRIDFKVDVDRAVHLFNLGLSPSLIARRLGHHTKTISNALKARLGTITPTKPYCAELITPPEMAGSHGHRVNPHFAQYSNNEDR